MAFHSFSCSRRVLFVILCKYLTLQIHREAIPLRMESQKDVAESWLLAAASREILQQTAANSVM